MRSRGGMGGRGGGGESKQNPAMRGDAYHKMLPINPGLLQLFEVFEFVFLVKRYIEQTNFK